jgi:hypothetical protein
VAREPGEGLFREGGAAEPRSRTAVSKHTHPKHCGFGGAVSSTAEAWQASMLVFTDMAITDVSIRRQDK